MFQYLVSGLATGATIVTYEGSPLKRPEMMWEVIDRLGVTVFGTSAKYIEQISVSAINRETVIPFSYPSTVLPTWIHVLLFAQILIVTDNRNTIPTSKTTTHSPPSAKYYQQARPSRPTSSTSYTNMSNPVFSSDRSLVVQISARYSQGEIPVYRCIEARSNRACWDCASHISLSRTPAL